MRANQKIPRTVLVSDGGSLVTNPSAETAGPANYIRNINTRRDQDHETLAYGWSTLPSQPPSAPKQIHELVQANGMRAIFAFCDTDIYRHNNTEGTWELVGQGYASGARWSVASHTGRLLFVNGEDPVQIVGITGPAERVWELWEMGIKTAAVCVVFNGYVLLMDITETIDGVDYRTPYRYMFSSDPTLWRWAAAASINVSQDKSTIILREPSHVLKVGDKITYVETIQGADEETAIIAEATITELGVGDEYEGYRYIKIDREVVSKADTYGMIVRFGYSEQIAGWEDLTGTGTPLLAAAVLQETLVIMCRDRFIVGQVTGTLPVFAWDQLSNFEGLSHPDLFSGVGGETIIYRGQQKWYGFELTSRRPVEIMPLELAKNLMEFEALGQYQVMENSIHNEVWIMDGKRTLVWDYRQNRVSELDRVVTAGLSGSHPNTWNPVFYIVEDGKVKAFAIEYDTEAETHLRDGEPVEAILEWGLLSSQQSELVLTAYRPIFASGSQIDCTVELYSHPRTDLPGKKIGERKITSATLVKAHARGQGLHDLIRFSTPIKIVGRYWDTIPQDSRITGFA